MAKSSDLSVNFDLSREELLQAAIARGEGILSSNGALAVRTGTRTGRSPKDRFIVRDSITDKVVDWGPINQPISPESFQQLWDRVQDYLAERDQVFGAKLYVGADPTYQTPVHLTSELAWQVLFAQDLFITEAHQTPNQPPWTIVSAPHFQTDPARDGVHSDAAIMLDFTHRRFLVCGTRYAGEIKKGMFTVLNFILPDHKVLPCTVQQIKVKKEMLPCFLVFQEQEKQPFQQTR